MAENIKVLVALDQAIARIADMLECDDGVAFKESGKELPRLIKIAEEARNDLA